MKRAKPSKERKKVQAATSQSIALKAQLDTAHSYWMAVEQVTQGRYLSGAELAIAEHAWSTYTRELKNSYRKSDQPRDAYVRVPEAEWPSAPQSATIPKITASELVQVAMWLAPQCQSKSSATVHESFPLARELLIQAASYLTDLRTREVLEVSFDAGGVTFDEILASNQKVNQTTLKLLPGIIGGGENAKGAERYKGLIKCIRRYYEQFFKRGRTMCEIYIRRRSLPFSELAAIRAWQYHEKRSNALKARQPVKKIDRGNRA